MIKHGIVGREISHGYWVRLPGKTNIQIATNTSGNRGGLNEPWEYAPITLNQAFKRDSHGRNAFSNSRGTLSVSWKFPDVEKIRENIAREEEIDIRLIGDPYLDKKGAHLGFYIDIVPVYKLIEELEWEARG